MASDLEICNAALMRLGNEPIASFSDNSKRAKLCLAHYDRIKKDFISKHPWNFSLKKVELLADRDTILPAAINIATDGITITGHGLKTGQRSFFKADGSQLPAGILLGRDYYVIKIDNNTIKLAETFGEANSGTSIGITDIGTGTFELFYSALFDFRFRFTAPSSYLTIFRVEPDTMEYQVEGDYIYSTDETYRMTYQANAQEKNFSIYAYQALILKLSIEFSYTLIQSNELRDMLTQEAERALATARLKDAQEGTPYKLTAEAWRNSRI